MNACSATAFDTYQKAHPGWTPDFPRPGIDPQETLASIYAPHKIERGSITEVQKLREFPGADETVIIAHVYCTAPKPIGWFYSDAISWYLLRDDRLAAWRHVAYQEYCHPVLEQRPIERDAKPSRDAVLQALETVTSAATAAALLEDSNASPPPAPSAAATAAAAETVCPGRGVFSEAMRDALQREPSIHTYFVSHDLVLTIAIEKDGSFELLKIRPTDFFARQLVQQVRKVSGSADRPVPPSCLLGTEIELEFAR